MQFDAREYQTVCDALKEVDSRITHSLYNNDARMALTDAENMREFCLGLSRIITTCAAIADAAMTPVVDCTPDTERERGALVLLMDQHIKSA